jgi:hypothetical protein
MRNPNAVEPTISAVPISLYRELCSELQEKNGEVTALKLKNQSILDENQQLRQELQRLVQMVMQTHHQVSLIPSADRKLDTSEAHISEALSPAAPAIGSTPTRRPLKSAAKTAVKPTVVQSLPANNLQPNRTAQPLVAYSPETAIVGNGNREEWLTGTHQPQSQNWLQQSATLAQELRGWRLALIISLIILSAFGAGFLIVRPLINNQTPRR